MSLYKRTLLIIAMAPTVLVASLCPILSSLLPGAFAVIFGGVSILPSSRGWWIRLPPAHVPLY